MANLTRIEAVQRAELVRVERYAVHLDLRGARTEATFDSTTVVQFQCRQPGAETFAELEAEAVVEATLNGEPVTVSEGRLALTELAAANELRVRSRHRYSNTVEGVHRFVDPEDGEVYLYVQAGPAYAQRIFACFDQPDLKAAIGLTVDCPPEWTVRANGAGVQESPGHWRFVDTAPISTYLMTFVAGPWSIVEAEHDGIPLGLLCRRSLGHLLDEQAPELLELTRSSFDRLHELFDIRYPFGRYDQAFVPEFTWGAVENPGCVTFREELLFRSAVTATELERRAVIIAHEMSHMWFGDLVTLRWWDDIWLNESFAEYMGWRVTAEATRFTSAWTDFAIWRRRTAIVADQRPSTHPIAPTDVADVTQGMLNFDGISYAKGAYALRQLVTWVGDEAFLRGLRSFFKTHAYGNATLADLLAALATASGRDLGQWADAWLRQPGVDTLEPVVQLAPDGHYREVAIVRTPPAEYPARRPHRLGVGVFNATGRLHAVELDLDPTVESGRTVVDELTGVAAGGLVLVNDGDRTFAKVRLDEYSLAGLSAILPRLDDSLARALIWAALADGTRDAELPPSTYYALALQTLPIEPQVTLFEEVLRFARVNIVDQYIAPAGRKLALLGLAETCTGALTTLSADLRVAAAHGFIACSGPSQLPALTNWLAERDLPPGLPLDPALRWAIRLRLSVLGANGEAEIAEEQRLDPSAEGVERAARCRAAFPDPAAKARAWELVTRDDRASGRIISATAEGFWYPEQAELCAPYVERYFAEMPSVAATRTVNLVQPAAVHLFPRYAIEPATLAFADAMLARPDLHPVLRRLAGDATDDLRRALAIRARYG